MWLSGYWAGKWGYLRAGAEQEQDPKENRAAASDLCAVCTLQNNKFHGYQVNSSRQTQSFKTTLPAYWQCGRHCSTPQLREISLAAHTGSELGNSTLSVALGRRQEIQFSRWTKNLVSSLRIQGDGNLCLSRILPWQPSNAARLPGCFAAQLPWR